MGLEKFIESVCVQTAVYWGNPQPDGFGGMTYDDPEEIGVRWHEQTEVITDAQGNEIISKAKILTPLDLDEQGVLLLGEITSEMTEAERANPFLLKGAYKIKRFDRIPLFRSTDQFVRTAYL